MFFVISLIDLPDEHFTEHGVLDVLVTVVRVEPAY